MTRLTQPAPALSGGQLVNDTPIISFSQSTYNTSETAGFVTITVNRSGLTSSAVSVDYATNDTGTPGSCANTNSLASSRCDFTPALGTLHFGAGETQKTFVALVNGDSYAEGPESFTVNLSNQTGGAILSAPSTATATIADDSTGLPPNAIDDSQFFVRQHYHDFLNREPDTSGFDFWTGQIDSCTPKPQCTEVKRIDVSTAFFLSIEFQGTGYLVERLYKASYGDATGTSTFNGVHQLSVPVVRFNEFLSDTQEIRQGVIVNQGNWEQQLENNKQAFCAEFVQRSRFTTAFPNSMTAAEFVDALNLNAGNPLSQAERDQLVADLSTNAQTRAQVLRAVAQDPDLNSAEFNRAFVLIQYFGYLRRNPDDPQDTDYTGYDFWLTKLNSFTQPGDDVLVRVQKAEMARRLLSRPSTGNGLDLDGRSSHGVRLAILRSVVITPPAIRGGVFVRLTRPQTDNVGVVKFMLLLHLDIVPPGLPPRKDILIHCRQGHQ